MKKVLSMGIPELGLFLGEVPSIVSEAFYNYLGEKNRKPRFETVFKVVKEEVGYIGYNFLELPTEQQEEIKAMALDAFEGMREAGF